MFFAYPIPEKNKCWVSANCNLLEISFLFCSVMFVGHLVTITTSPRFLPELSSLKFPTGR